MLISHPGNLPVLFNISNPKKTSKHPANSTKMCVFFFIAWAQSETSFLGSSKVVWFVFIFFEANVSWVYDLSYFTKLLYKFHSPPHFLGSIFGAGMNLNSRLFCSFDSWCNSFIEKHPSFSQIKFATYFSGSFISGFQKTQTLKNRPKTCFEHFG